MKKFMIAVVMSGVILLVLGCASIVSNSQWPVTINSKPSGAALTIKNNEGIEMLKATTPTTVTLSSKGGYFRPAVYHFEFEKEGFSPVNKEVSAGFNGWYIGNIVFGGLIGIVIVDPLTGAMWRLDELVSQELSPKPNIPLTSVKPEAITSSSTALDKKPSTEISKPNSPSPSDLGTQSNSSNPSENDQKLRELKKLKDEGLLTEEEYAQKKKAIVDRI